MNKINITKLSKDHCWNSSTSKERKRPREESISTISENVDTHTVSSVDLTRLPDEPEWSREGVYMERI